ncbi:MAG TPA: N-acetylmuramic acid 6-phosphate etherase [Rhodothermales bacterium]|nr:N-acetylmuramic acid 6-phosphate etherase [Bacteroidota bacterium]HRK73170.1 N-acetylmuramic acid 6-phosphate etherase [Rhodothermales bacterium]HRR08377.1 N-acetylmuramic acid 6-phosphate etherase [Rhodothermales bacterium]
MNANPDLFSTLETLATEQRNPASENIDTEPIWKILEIINTEDHLVPIAVRREIPQIARLVEWVETAFRSGGRLIYVGAGTSGRLGILDASECPPTYGVPPEWVDAVIAGGPDAVFRSKEGAEDVPEDGMQELRNRSVSDRDVVCGIAASGRTPFVFGALEYAHQVGAKTILITTNPRHSEDTFIDLVICPIVGPEVVMGSTRMKSGTAQKLVLNMITTATMIRLGKVYKNMMVDLQMTNEKLIERSKRIVMLATDVSYDEAQAALEAADGHVKVAIVMILNRVDPNEARSILLETDGFVRKLVQ